MKFTKFVFLLLIILLPCIQVYSQIDMTLIEAVERGDIESVQLLIEAGADLNAENEYGETPLIIALDNGSSEIARALQEAGAVFDPRSEIALAYFFNTVEYDDFECAQCFIDAGIDLNAEFDGKTALSTAVCRGKIDMIELLLAAGAERNTDVSVQDWYSHRKYTMPLLPAVLYTMSQAADESKLEQWADLASDLIASANGEYAAVEIDGVRTPALIMALISAAAFPGSDTVKDIIAQLIACGADVNEPISFLNGHGNAGKNGASPLIVAVMLGGELGLKVKERMIELSDMLIDAGADTSLTDEEGFTALDIAEEAGYTEVMELLKAIPGS